MLVGLHRRLSRRPGELEIAIQLESKFLTKAAGVPADFVARVHATPHDAMWFPSTKELLQAKVITGVADPSRFAPTGLGAAATAENVGAALVKLGFYESIRRVDPNAFATIRGLWLAVATGTRTMDQLMPEMRREIGTLVGRHIGAASDESAREYGSTMLAQLEHVRQLRPELCVRIFRDQSEASTIEVASLISMGLQQRENDALEGVFLSAALDPQQTPSQRQVSHLFDRVNNELYKRYGNKLLVLSRSSIPKGERVAACDMFLAYIREILSLDRDEGSKMLRYMFADADVAVQPASSGGSANLLKVLPRQDGRK